MTDQYGLLLVWPITATDYDRDALIAEAREALDTGDLDWLNGVPGRPTAGPSTWRVINGADLDGWEWWSGQLLVATMPGTTARTGGSCA